MSVYDPIAELYDAWSRQVTEDIAFYVDEALAAGGTVVELGVGTGRIAVPTAAAGVRVIGVDSSSPMLDVCRRRAAASPSQSTAAPPPRSTPARCRLGACTAPRHRRPR